MIGGVFYSVRREASHQPGPPKPEVNANSMDHALPHIGRHYTEHDASKRVAGVEHCNQRFHMHFLEIARRIERSLCISLEGDHLCGRSSVTCDTWPCDLAPNRAATAFESRNLTDMGASSCAASDRESGAQARRQETSRTSQLHNQIRYLCANYLDSM